MAEGVVRTIVVTTMVLPLETERNVDGDSEGVGVSLGGGVEGVEGEELEDEEVEDVEDGGGVEGGEVEFGFEVDPGKDDELPSEVLFGGGGAGGVDVFSPGVDAGLELQERHKRLIFHNRCDARYRALTVGVGEQTMMHWMRSLHFRSKK